MITGLLLVGLWQWGLLKIRKYCLLLMESKRIKKNLIGYKNIGNSKYLLM